MHFIVEYVLLLIHKLTRSFTLRGSKQHDRSIWLCFIVWSWKVSRSLFCRQVFVVISVFFSRADGFICHKDAKAERSAPPESPFLRLKTLLFFFVCLFVCFTRLYRDEPRVQVLKPLKSVVFHQSHVTRSQSTVYKHMNLFYQHHIVCPVIF